MKYTAEEITLAYKVTFASEHGRLVLADLTKIAARTPISGDNPNANAAIYRCAQQDLIRRITKMLGLRADDE